MPSAILVDPHTLVRQALARIIEDELHISVVAEAADCNELLVLSKGYCPDWLIIDPGMHPVAILDTLHRLRCSCEHTRIILLTAEHFLPFMDRAFRTGMNACLSKHNGLDELHQAFDTVKRGRQYVSTRLAQSLVQSSLAKGEQSALQTLTNRELQIMHLFVQGNSVEKIAKALCLSPKTVSTYRYRIFDKLGVRNDVSLTHIARQHGFLDETVSRQQHQAA